MDYFFTYKIFKGGTTLLKWQVKGVELGGLVLLTVGKKVEYALLHGCRCLFRGVVYAVVNAHVTNVAVGGALFSKISQELAATADVVVLSIGNDRLYALYELLAAVVIDLRSEVEAV